MGEGACFLCIEGKSLPHMDLPGASFLVLQAKFSVENEKQRE